MKGPRKKRKVCTHQLDKFPRLVLHNIMKYLSVNDVLQLRTTCRRIRIESTNDRLWEFLTERDFGKLKKLPFDEHYSAVYQEEYQSFKILSSINVGYCDIFISLQWDDLDINLTKSALRRNCDPAAGDNWAIRIAADRGHDKVVELLLADPCVDPAAADNWAIHCAAVNGHDKVVKLLLADPRVDPAVWNNVAIYSAAENGHIEVVKLLVADERVCNLLDDDDRQKFGNFCN